ncbi:hypothetical protein DF107_18195 [Burkholderia stagnalis]|uniref:hypothetical protein n=1 Tax=Burkholderia stagnalis TaxID=1503054 RepID=UPI000752FF30|nr:hypothetical protein [Burkholderia stagnalis]KVL84185.1 hypothetical protein WT03_02485 [Burkholderia stagnalis]KVL98409.1 hypothetical protein WT02_10255 [Burkholderia stagnalis]KVM16700.1 hypothetical protein WT04_03235 [Burkholderia stagnalis]KVX62473.1 hypothetical protein WT33_14190 [Burkholderia stagnalis]RQQ19733.1 hypothetical protein DF161_07120 [Burkholderia stagnalis]
MALDPSISLQVQPVQVQNPLTAYAQVAAVQGAQRQNQLYDLAIQDKQREVAQAQALNDAFRAPGAVNPDGTLNASSIVGNVAASGNGAAVPGLAKSLAETQSAQLAQQKASVDGALQKIGAIGQVLNGVTDQTSYDLARQWAASHLGADSVANMPAVYNPTLVANKQREALTVMQQLDQHSKAIDQQLAQSQFGETQRHNLATEGIETRAQNMRALEYDPKNGVVVNKATGQSTPVLGADGKPISTSIGNLSGEQSNAVAFGARALDAQNMLRQLEAGGTTNTNPVYRAAGAVPVIGGALAGATNFMNSDQQQSYEQAKRNFISAVLRKESGAAIAESEFVNEDKKYFPQAGDSPATIEQKARSRDLAIEALKAQAGPGAGLIPSIVSNANQDYASQPRPGAPAARQPAAAPGAQPQPAAASAASDTALAELRRRAASNPTLAARLKAMGY